MVLTKCFEAIDYPNGDNRIFEVPVNCSYLELQNTVDKAYGGQSMIIQYVDEQEETITIDTDYPLKRCIHFSVKNSMTNSEELTMRLLVTNLNISYF